MGGGGGGGGVDYAAIEAQKKADREAAEAAAKEEAFASELERLRTQRGRASTMLTSDGAGTKSYLG